MMNRLNHLPTLKIESAQKIPFIYKEKQYYGVKGDTIASALFANGVRVFSRSLKYHRPRGLYSLDGECSNTLMEVNGVPNVRCENTLLESGMIVQEQNVKGSAENDMMSFMDKLDWMMPAGFYYDVMHKPAKIWPVAIRQIRKTAGLGTICPNFELPDRFDEVFLTADVCVIGGGPAGMMSAIASAEQGLRVVLLESRPWLGGFFEYRSAKHSSGCPLHDRAAELVASVRSHDNIRLFTHTPCVGTYNNGLVTGFQTGTASDAFSQRYVEIRAGSIVAATGSIERPLIFDNNERPGVMQIGCALRMAKTYGLLPGNEAVFSIGHDLGLEAAVELHDLGLSIACIADIREDGQDPSLLETIAAKNIPLFKGWVAQKAFGRKRVRKVRLTSIDGMMKRAFSCDLLVASAGMTPVTGPITIAQGKLSYDDYTGCFLPSTLPEGMFPAGRVLGLSDAASIEASGRLAGLKASLACGAGSSSEVEKAEKALASLPGPARGTKLAAAPVKGRKSFICFDEDATIKNIKQAIHKGFDVPELIKRFTATGLGPGQGGIPGHNLPLYVARYQMLPDMAIRPTNVRPPLVPTLIATYAGTNHKMFKTTPIDAMQRKDGGIFRNIGVWQRARYFSSDYSCRSEILNVRNNVGMLDGSTLGKFRLHGPDALKVLQRIYVSDMSRVKEGRIKYSAMCNEDGCVIDDGVVVKLDENDYYFTTSTGRAGQTIEWIRYHTRYDGWDFAVVNLTDAMGVINLSGPNARKVLEQVVDIDISNTAFGFSEYKETTLAGTIPVRAMRLGFVGELSYELHVPASYMQAAWLMIKKAGRPFNIQNFGVEAQNVLRMEKGHIILGQESEQRTNLLDIGLGFLWDRSKTDAKTVGAVALHQAENHPARLKLVGFKMENHNRAPRDGSLIVDDTIRGYVCTARESFTLKEAVGMALVEAELAKIGTRLSIYEDECGDERIYGTVVNMPFYDPEGQRMKI